MKGAYRIIMMISHSRLNRGDFKNFVLKVLSEKMVFNPKKEIIFCKPEVT